MKKKSKLLLTMIFFAATACSNDGKTITDDNKTIETSRDKALVEVYDDTANPLDQIDEALSTAAQQGKYVIAQVGGNWCPWCLRFAQFITDNNDINTLIEQNFVYFHINAFHVEDGKRMLNEEAMKRLGNPSRFGYPVMVVLDAEGNVIHIQDSAMLEDGDSYNTEMVYRFFNNWTPQAVQGNN